MRKGFLPAPRRCLPLPGSPMSASHGPEPLPERGPCTRVSLPLAGEPTILMAHSPASRLGVSERPAPTELNAPDDQLGPRSNAGPRLIPRSSGNAFLMTSSSEAASVQPIGAFSVNIVHVDLPVTTAEYPDD
jgi:hypothetical protein